MGLGTFWIPVLTEEGGGVLVNTFRHPNTSWRKAVDALRNFHHEGELMENNCVHSSFTFI
jgi:hypothetical protein